MIDDSNRNSLVQYISWDGNRLGDLCSLPDDLTFRRMLTAAFSPGRPFSRRAIRGLIERTDSLFRKLVNYVFYTDGGDEGLPSTLSEAKTAAPQFDELLKRAILTVSGDTDFLRAISEKKESAPDSLRGALLGNLDPPLESSEVWAARFLIFQQLIDDPDFHEYVLECDEGKPPWLKFVNWGERIRLPEPPTAKKQEAELAIPPPPRLESPTRSFPVAGTGSVWEGLFRPMMTSWLYIVPIAIGAGSVGSYIIDRQAEVRVAPTIENNVPPADTAQLQQQITAITSALNSNTESIKLVAKSENAIITKLESMNILAPQINVLPSPPVTGTLSGNITVGKDFWGGLSDAAAILPPLTVRLGNESKSDRLSLGLDLGELNLRQEPYPTEMVTPAHPVGVGDRRPALVEIGKKLEAVVTPPHTLWSPPDPKTGQPKLPPVIWTGNAYFYLCDWRIPARFLIASGNPTKPEAASLCKTKTPPTDASASKTNTATPPTPRATKPGVKWTESPYYVFTKTAQYVPELDAYVSLDEASRQRFVLLGSRRIVLQIVPNGGNPTPPVIQSVSNVAR